MSTSLPRAADRQGGAARAEPAGRQHPRLWDTRVKDFVDSFVQDRGQRHFSPNGQLNRGQGGFHDGDDVVHPLHFLQNENVQRDYKYFWGRKIEKGTRQVQSVKDPS